MYIKITFLWGRRDLAPLFPESPPMTHREIKNIASSKLLNFISDYFSTYRSQAQLVKGKTDLLYKSLLASTT